MKYAIITLATISMMLSSLGLAADASHCEDLSKLACDSKIKPDGTGFSRNPDTAPDTDIFYKRCFPPTVNDPKIRSILLNALQKKELAKGCKPQSTSQTCEKIFDRMLTVIFRCAQEGYGCKDQHSMFNEKSLAHPLIFMMVLQFSGRWRVEQAKLPIQNPKVHERNKTKTFPKIKELLIKKVQSLDIDPKQKKIMLERLSKVSLGSPNCRQYLSAFAPNAYFDTGTGAVHHCDSALRYSTSDFAAAFTIGHEISHMIDPCTILTDRIRPFISNSRPNSPTADELYPLKSTVACMRSKDSVGAKNRICPDDQSSEAMCDWFASEVLTDYIKTEYPNLTKQQWINGAANVWSMFCPISKANTSDDNPHPSSFSRLNNLFLTQPDIRKQLGCSAQPKHAKYCSAPTIRNSTSNSQRTEAVR